jgi:hypothetical protein
MFSRELGMQPGRPPGHTKIKPTMAKLQIAVLFIGLLTIITSCSGFKKSDYKIIKGNYQLIKTDKLNDSTTQIVFFIYDKRTNTPLSNAFVHINELNTGGFTQFDGTLVLDLPAGAYTITVGNTGNTTIQTNLINFKPSTITEIKFELGTKIFYCN